MKKVMLMSALALVVSVAGIVALAQTQTKTTYTGYLMDKMCSGEATSSKDPMASAKEHTRSCALMKSCMASGYGIVSDKKFYPFDEKGNELAKQMLKTTKKKDNLSIEVVGTSTADGNIQVESLKETK